MKENSTLDLSRGLMCESNLDAYLSRNQSVFCDEDVIIFLNQLYQRTDLSKAALARQAGMSEVYLHQVFSGRRRPSRDRLPRLVRWGLTFLFVNIAWVFFRAPDLTGAVELLRTALTGGLAKPEPWLLDALFSKETGALEMILPALTPWMNIFRIVVSWNCL